MVNLDDSNKKPMRAAANKAVESPSQKSKLRTRTSNPKPRTPSKMQMPVTVEEVAAAPPSSQVINSDDSSASASVLSNAEKKKKKKKRMRAEAVESASQKSEPIDDASKLKKRRSNPNPITETVEEEEVAEGGKKSQKLWSEEDEIVILQGMVDYKEAKGADPMSDTADFHDFVKKSLHVDVSQRQVVDKVRRLKRRYQKIACKNDLTPHEDKTIQLSNLIWINIANTTTPSPSKPTTTTKVSFMGKLAVEMGLNEDFVKTGIQLCSEENKADMEQRWKQLHLDEDALFLRKMELARQETNLITQALKSAGKIE